MSNVLARDRGLSSLTFYTHLMKTRDLLLEFFSEKNFKAREYYTYCLPIVQSMVGVTQNLIIANSIYPINEHEVMIRRDYQNIAIGMVEHAIIELTVLLKHKGLSLKKGEKMRTIIDALQLEVKYIKWWRKQNNSLMRKFRDTDVGEKFKNDKTGILAGAAKLGVSPAMEEISSQDKNKVGDRDLIYHLSAPESPIFYLSDTEHQNKSCESISNDMIGSKYPESPIYYLDSSESTNDRIVEFETKDMKTNSQNLVKNKNSSQQSLKSGNTRKRRRTIKATNFFDAV